MIGAFAKMMSGVNSKITEGEKELQVLLGEEGIGASLLSIVLHAQVDVQMKTASICTVKELVDEKWNKPEALTASTRQNIRSGLVQVLAKHYETAQVWKTAEECLFKIISIDYPEACGSMLHDVTEVLKDGVKRSAGELFAGLMVLKCMVGVYELQVGTNREPLKAIIQLSFPPLVQLLQQLLQADEAQAGVACRYARMCVQCFEMSVQMELSDYFADAGVLDAWMSCFLRIFDMKLVAAGEEHPATKLLKTSLRTTSK